MLGVYSLVEIKPECKRDFEALIQLYIEEGRHCKGCQSYDYGALANQPNTYCFIERWDSQADLDAHYASDFSNNHRPKLEVMLIRTETQIFELM